MELSETCLVEYEKHTLRIVALTKLTYTSLVHPTINPLDFFFFITFFCSLRTIELCFLFYQTKWFNQEKTLIINLKPCQAVNNFKGIVAIFRARWVSHHAICNNDVAKQLLAWSIVLQPWRETFVKHNRVGKASGPKVIKIVFWLYWHVLITIYVFMQANIEQSV